MNHTTSLEVSKRLKEAGWNKPCELYYQERSNGEVVLYTAKDLQHTDKNRKDIFPRLTLGELIRELPTHSITCYGDGEGLCRNWDSLEEKYEADTPENAAGLALEALLKKEKGE